MSSFKNKLVIVLGMHRSGTSAITRGLEVLGVNLGSNLLPPTSENERGYFEDAEIYELNIELLNAISLDWQSLSAIADDTFDVPKFDVYKNRAKDLLNARLTDRTYGIKDPRMCRLLPFWQAVFDSLSIEPLYVITSRHPSSVVSSLQKRDGLHESKAYYLWMIYVLSALKHTRNCKRVLVDFDKLILDPSAQLARIADASGTYIDMSSQPVITYTKEFLDNRLSHTNYALSELLKQNLVPDCVYELYEFLINVSEGKCVLDDLETLGFLDKINKQLSALALSFDCIDSMQKEIDSLKKSNELLVLQLQDELLKVSQLELHRENVFASTSWKVTLPLRIVSAYFKDLLNTNK